MILNQNTDPAALEAFFNTHLLGQENAAKRFANGIMREAELYHEDRPRGTFLFLGPTGVGKTEMTQQAARYLYGEEWKKHFYRIDMAEFQTQDSLDALLGKDMDSRQGSLGEAVDRMNAVGGGMILFDEIEKASQELNKVFYGVLDAARVSMRNGQVKSLANFYLVATSNLGTDRAVKMEHAPYTTIERVVLGAAEKYFGSPLFYRFRERVVFRKLSRDVQFGLADKMIADEIRHIESRLNVEVVFVDEQVKPFMIRSGYNDKAGARPMRDAVHNLLSDVILQLRRDRGGEITGQKIRIVTVLNKLQAEVIADPGDEPEEVAESVVPGEPVAPVTFADKLREDGFDDGQIETIGKRIEEFGFSRRDPVDSLAVG